MIYHLNQRLLDSKTLRDTQLLAKLTFKYRKLYQVDKGLVHSFINLDSNGLLCKASILNLLVQARNNHFHKAQVKSKMRHLDTRSLEDILLLYQCSSSLVDIYLEFIFRNSSSRQIQDRFYIPISHQLIQVQGLLSLEALKQHSKYH